ncbi:MAG: hypothetical protein U5L72_19445 [Bacteroidales bacterium]|nr:hypothetical protein [Bacteroidales bacterium]
MTKNRDGLEDWTEVILADGETSQYVYGSAVHWYESTHKVYEEVFEKVNDELPGHNYHAHRRLYR